MKNTSALTAPFPDQRRLPGKILLKKEQGENFDEHSNWIKRSTETRELVWSAGRLTSDSDESQN